LDIGEGSAVLGNAVMEVKKRIPVCNQDLHLSVMGNKDCCYVIVLDTNIRYW